MRREEGRKVRPVEGRERVLSTCSRQTGTCPAKWWTWRPLPNHRGSTSLPLSISFGSLFKYLTLYRSPYLSRGRGRAGFTGRCAHQRTRARMHDYRCTPAEISPPMLQNALLSLLTTRPQRIVRCNVRAWLYPVNGCVNGKRGRPAGYDTYRKSLHNDR